MSPTEVEQRITFPIEMEMQGAEAKGAATPTKYA
jgi:Cu/Ag efflux pump CusA